MSYNYNHKETFTVKSSASMETSYGLLDREDDVELEITVGVSDEDEYGFFEIYDLETGGDRFYGEGGLWFDDIALHEYDGVFELSQHVITKLEQWGYDCSLIKN